MDQPWQQPPEIPPETEDLPLAGLLAELLATSDGGGAARAEPGGNSSGGEAVIEWPVEVAPPAEAPDLLRALEEAEQLRQDPEGADISGILLARLIEESGAEAPAGEAAGPATAASISESQSDPVASGDEAGQTALASEEWPPLPAAEEPRSGTEILPGPMAEEAVPAVGAEAPAGWFTPAPEGSSAALAAETAVEPSQEGESSGSESPSAAQTEFSASAVEAVPGNPVSDLQPWLSPGTAEAGDGVAQRPEIEPDALGQVGSAGPEAAQEGTAAELPPAAAEDFAAPAAGAAQPQAEAVQISESGEAPGQGESCRPEAPAEGAAGGAFLTAAQDIMPPVMEPMQPPASAPATRPAFASPEFSNGEAAMPAAMPAAAAFDPQPPQVAQTPQQDDDFELVDADQAERMVDRLLHAAISVFRSTASSAEPPATAGASAESDVPSPPDEDAAQAQAPEVAESQPPARPLLEHLQTEVSPIPPAAALMALGLPERLRTRLESIGDLDQLLKSRSTLTPAPEQGPRLVVFRAGGQTFGLDMKHVREVERVGRVTAVPGAPGFVKGLVNLRGEILPLLDLAALLGHAGQSDAPGRLVVAQAGPEDPPVALLVEELNGLAPLRSDGVGPAPRTEISRGVIEHRGREVVWLDPGAVFGAAALERAAESTGRS
ncbi:MAG: chemotaxis protein CheW [Bryobacteraceae bacterium]